MSTTVQLPPPRIYCTFCGKHQDEVKVIVMGVGACICDECVALSSAIVKERLEAQAKK